MTAMVMPETTVHENHCCVTRKDKVRRAGKVAPVEPETKAKSMHD